MTSKITLTLGRICFLITNICFIFAAGCAKQQNVIKLQKRGYFERCVVENLILEESHGGKLPLNIAYVDSIRQKKIYRSGKLKAAFIPYLSQLGIKSIVTLSTVSDDTRKQIQLYGIQHKEFDFISTEMTYQGIQAAIDQIMAFPEPVLVHCRAGADRTGIVIAALRATLGEDDPEILFEEMNTYCHITFYKYYYYHDLLNQFIQIAKQNAAKRNIRREIIRHTNYIPK